MHLHHSGAVDDAFGEDGLGARTWRHDDVHGDVEVRRVAPALTRGDAARAMQARAEALAAVPASVVSSVYRVEALDECLQVTARAVEGVRLSAILRQLEDGELILDDERIVQLIMRVIRSVAVLHAAPGFLAHGALTPAHIVVDERDVVLTDAVYGPSLQDLQWNRVDMWRTFGIALPWSASVIRFDQRTDVSQMGAVALAIALRRQLTPDEYPRCAERLVVTAAERLAGNGPAIGAWLERALQLQPRAPFSSAIEAGQAFADLTAFAGRRAGPRRPLVTRAASSSFRPAPLT